LKTPFFQTEKEFFGTPHTIMKLKPEIDMNSTEKRPLFPQKAIITAGMPYGNKDLHFGHAGGYFIHADVFARFLRDRIGRENVIFVSGTDCYGSPIAENFRQLKEKNEFAGDLQDYVRSNHEKQVESLKLYNIELNLYGASSFGRSSEIHKKISDLFISTLYKNGHLLKLSSPQFFDAKMNVFLNGRQVIGQCPIQNCNSEHGYADECSLGHQYEPADLINPKSTLSGDVPEMRNVTNWFVDLESFKDELVKWIEDVKNVPGCRNFAVNYVEEFFAPPVIYVKRDQAETLDKIAGQLPEHKREDDKSKAIILAFKNLNDRENARTILANNSVRFRTGKTLVPFRLTGNIDWGVPVPVIEDLKNLVFWVWPESLWAPISFTSTYLEKIGKNPDGWKDWWCSKDARVYQFLGEDNIYFYGPAEMAMFMGMQEGKSVHDPAEGQLQLPELIVNNHILFFSKKASSSGKIKPPMARDLLDFYTSDQLRTHFFSLGLGVQNVGFQPKPYNPEANDQTGDPVMKEGNLLSNVFNRAVRSCFYTLQKYFDARMPTGSISPAILEEANSTILKYEELMYRHEFHKVMALVDNYIRQINKYWTKTMNIQNDGVVTDSHKQALIDSFHMVRVASVLLHPIAPEGTGMILEYLNLKGDFWDWNRIFDTIYDFMDDPQNHKFKFLEPRIDFFRKHPSQVSYK
jgi:methionyl-tRNA synthetase